VLFHARRTTAAGSEQTGLLVHTMRAERNLRLLLNTAPWCDYSAAEYPVSHSIVHNVFITKIYLKRKKMVTLHIILIYPHHDTQAQAKNTVTCESPLLGNKYLQPQIPIFPDHMKIHTHSQLRSAKISYKSSSSTKCDATSEAGSKCYP
jgi:hypothetical protein